MKKNKYFIVLAVMILVFAVSKVVNWHLAGQEVKEQEQSVALSYKAYSSFSLNYFKCNQASVDTLDKFVKNHELKVRRLMFLKKDQFVQLEQQLDSFKLEAQSRAEECSIPAVK